MKLPKQARKRLTLTEIWRYLRTNDQQAHAEKALRERGVNFRQLGGQASARNYGQMTTTEFEQINSRQEWANWLLIGACLDGRVPDRPLNVLDIGCGSGTSTKVLAYYCPAGSRIVANDIAANLIDAAKQKHYRNCHTQESVQPEFVTQDATVPFVDASGAALAPGSIDYANTSGIVGHHLSAVAFANLAQNLARVTRTGGFAAIDEGPSLGEADIKAAMQAADWRFVTAVRILPWLKSGQLLFTRLS